MRSYSNSGSKYVITFVDRKSRLVRVEFLKKKSEVTQKTKNFINWVKNQRDKYPKNFTSDGGGEYVTKDLKEFCEELGINMEITEAYSPNMNGIAERINRTIVEGSYALLHQAGLPNSFWEDAMDYFVYVKNRAPHSALDGKRPIDVWNEELGEVEREDIWNLKTFGCRAEVHIPPNFRIGGKDGPKTRTCVYLGRARNRKTDKFWDTDRNKIVFGYASEFREEEFPKNPKASKVTLSVDSTNKATQTNEKNNGCIDNKYLTSNCRDSSH